MSFNLLDTVKGLFTGDVISTAAASLGESEGGIQKALSGAIPAILSGLVAKATTTGGAAGILDMARQAKDSGILNSLNGFLNSDNSNLIGTGAEMLKGLLGDKAGGIASMVSNFAGIKHSSASSVMSMAAPVALGAVGKYASEQQLDASDLSNFLASQKDGIVRALPASFASVAGLLGIGSTAGGHYHAETTHHATHEVAAPDSNSRVSTKFLVPFFLGIAAVLLAIYIFKGCGAGTHEKEAVAETDTIAPKIPVNEASITTAVTTRELFKVKLPNDTILEAYKGGIEDKLVAFLGTDYKKLGEDSLKKIWFDFDNLNFETGSARITAESRVQVNNLAAILKAFPAVKLKIGGYTDKVGDETANKKLSDARAKAVQAALVAAGVGAQVTGAEGYGSAFAKYAAEAPETDRVTDRHVSVSVR